MNFEQAMELVLAGRSVRRLGWHKDFAYIARWLTAPDRIYLHWWRQGRRWKSDRRRLYKPTREDRDAQDWVDAGEWLDRLMSERQEKGR